MYIYMYDPGRQAQGPPPPWYGHPFSKKTMVLAMSLENQENVMNSMKSIESTTKIWIPSQSRSYQIPLNRK